MEIDAIFFDFDGTLGDTDVDIRASWLAAIKKLDLNCENFDQIFRVGPPVFDTASTLFPNMTFAELTQLVNAYKSFYDEAESYRALPYPGIIELLKNLKNHGKKIYIVTNKRIKPLKKLVCHLGLSDLCHGIFAPDIIDPQNHLSKTDLLAVALRISGVPPENCLMVGDTELDVQAAHANHIAACAVTWGYGQYDQFISSNPELIIDHPVQLQNSCI